MFMIRLILSFLEKLLNRDKRKLTSLKYYTQLIFDKPKGSKKKNGSQQNVSSMVR